MKNFYLIIIALLSFSAHSQFIYWKANEEIPEQVMVYMNDNTSKAGYIKNNKVSNVGKRMLTLDPKLFRHGDVEANVILFKAEGTENYVEIPANNIKYVVFSGEEPTRFDRINVYKFERKSLEIKDKEPVTMFQIPRVDDYVVMYANYYINLGRNGSLNDELYFYVKQKDSDKSYYMRFFSFNKDKQIFPYLKILAPKNEKFTAYIDKLCDKKSVEYKEYKKGEEELMEEFSKYAKENRKELSIVDGRSMQYNTKFRYMFFYIGKKLEQFSS